MRVRRVADAVDVLNRGVERGVVTDRVVGPEEVVVDGAGAADDGDAVLFVQERRAHERTVPANGDERVEAGFFGLTRSLGAAFGRAELLGAGALENRPAFAEDVRDALAAHVDEVAVDEPGVATPYADDFEVFLRGAADDGADAGVHARRVTARGEHADSGDIWHLKLGG